MFYFLFFLSLSDGGFGQRGIFAGGGFCPFPVTTIVTTFIMYLQSSSSYHWLPVNMQLFVCYPLCGHFLFICSPLL